MLKNVASYHSMQFQGKLRIKLEKMAENLVSGPILSPLVHIWASKHFLRMLPLLDVRHWCKLLLYAILRKTNEPNLRKWLKTWFWVQFRLIWPKFGPPKFFFSKICLRQSLDIMVSYHHVQYQKKLMIQSWENLVTDGRIDGQIDKSAFIGRSPTNVERPK